MVRHTLAALVAASAIVAMSAPGWGQTAEPVHLDALGLTIQPPADAIAARETAGGVATLLLADASTPEAWRVRFQLLRANSPDATSRALAQEHLDQLGDDPVNAQVIMNEPVTYAGRDGWLLYVRQDRSTPPVVRGWLILPAGEPWFLVGAVLAQPDQFEPIRALLDTTFRSIQLEDRQAVADERQARFTNGAALLATFTPERLRSLVGTDQWFRIYRPGETGDTEIGYTHLEVLEGSKTQLGQVEPKEPSPGDELGLFVRIHAHFVGERGVTMDSLATYWQSWHRDQEQWSITTTSRQGEASVTQVETGVLTGGPRRKLTVITEDSQSRRKDTLAWEVPSMYLSQPEHWLLSRLLPMAPREEREFACYFYDSTRNELSQRHDVWSPSELGRWTLTTSIGAGAARWQAIYDGEGNLIRHQRADGTLTEPIDLARLRRLWSGRGQQWSQ